MEKGLIPKMLGTPLPDVETKDTYVHAIATTIAITRNMFTIVLTMPPFSSSTTMIFSSPVVSSEFTTTVASVVCWDWLSFLNNLLTHLLYSEIYIDQIRNTYLSYKHLPRNK